MRIFTIIFLLFAGLIFLIGAVILPPIARDLGECYEEGTVRFNLIAERADTEKWSKEQICLNGKKELDSVGQCISKVEKRRSLPKFVASLVTNIAKFLFSQQKLGLEDFKKEHNTVCAEFPSALVE